MVINEAQRLAEDFSNGRGPFDGEAFPEEKLLSEVEPQNAYEKAMLLTAFCTLDYNRDAMQLKDNLVELYERSSVWFAPKTLTGDSFYSQDALAEVMDEIGFRYKNRDARGLWHNYELIVEKYGTVQSLLSDVEHDAVQLVERLEEDGFLYLKGVKLAPFYARLLSEHVAELDNLWSLDIPVDVHIRRLSKDLFDEDIEDDTIRSRWQTVAEFTDISPAVVDGALWLVGNRWDDWGEDYWQEVTH